MPPSPDLSLLGQYGAIGVMLGIFVWLHLRALKRTDEAAARCESREAACQQRIDAHEKFERETLLPLIQETKSAMKESAEAARGLAQTIRETHGSGGHKTP